MGKKQLKENTLTQSVFLFLESSPFLSLDRRLQIKAFRDTYGLTPVIFYAILKGIFSVSLSRYERTTVHGGLN